MTPEDRWRIPEQLARPLDLATNGRVGEDFLHRQSFRAVSQTL